MSNFECILFDWDGCLAKTLDLWLAIYKKIAVKRGINLSAMTDIEIVERSFGKSTEGLEELGIKDSERAYGEALELFEKESRGITLYDGAKEILENLRKRQIRLALHTSSFRRLVDPALDKYNLRKYFEVILTREDIKLGKPNPEVILKELSLLRVDKNKAVIVGDSDHDFKAGKSVGVKTILFYPEGNRKFYRREFLMKENPDFVIQDLREILGLI